MMNGSGSFYSSFYSHDVEKMGMDIPWPASGSIYGLQWHPKGKVYRSLKDLVTRLQYDDLTRRFITWRL